MSVSMKFPMHAQTAAPTRRAPGSLRTARNGLLIPPMHAWFSSRLASRFVVPVTLGAAADLRSSGSLRMSSRT
eukprot:1073705-Heterocapsa_arctica.AAC.1